MKGADFAHVQVQMRVSMIRPDMILLWPISHHMFGILCQNLFDHFSCHVGEAEVSPVEPVGESLMIETAKMQDGGVEIVETLAFLDRLVSELVRLTHMNPALHPATGEPPREGMGIVVPSGSGAL